MRLTEPLRTGVGEIDLEWSNHCLLGGSRLWTQKRVEHTIKMMKLRSRSGSGLRYDVRDTTRIDWMSHQLAVEHVEVLCGLVGPRSHASPANLRAQRRKELSSQM